MKEGIEELAKVGWICGANWKRTVGEESRCSRHGGWPWPRHWEDCNLDGLGEGGELDWKTEVGGALFSGDNSARIVRGKKEKWKHINITEIVKRIQESTSSQ